MSSLSRASFFSTLSSYVERVEAHSFKRLTKASVIKGLGDAPSMFAFVTGFTWVVLRCCEGVENRLTLEAHTFTGLLRDAAHLFEHVLHVAAVGCCREHIEPRDFEMSLDCFVVCLNLVSLAPFCP
jgi:hypothetical protein